MRYLESIFVVIFRDLWVENSIIIDNPACQKSSFVLCSVILSEYKLINDFLGVEGLTVVIRLVVPVFSLPSDSEFVRIGLFPVCSEFF